MVRARSFSIVTWVAVCIAAVVAACQATTPSDPGPLDPIVDSGGVVDDATFERDGGSGDTDPFNIDAAPIDPDAAALAITPMDAIIDVTFGGPPPTLSYKATASGVAVAPAWSIDRGEIGTIGVGTGVFTPSGTLGGKATISATYKGAKVSTSVTVRLKMTQNGAPSGGGDAGVGDGGAGGTGGVGGEGSGPSIDDATRAILTGAKTAEPKLAFLYPYDGTVWPRGILAPLLQWDAGGHSFDAVHVHITEKGFEFNGFFGKTASSPFVRHPMPQEAWKKLAYSNGGEEVLVELTFHEGGKAYGPLTQKWKIASGPLKGTVYYNSYGTALAKNYCCTTAGAQFGGATLAIKAGASDPTLIAGTDGDGKNCRVCHSVAANGSTLITQKGDNYAASGLYPLTGAPGEVSLAPNDGRFAWAGIYPDGSLAFSNSSAAHGGSTAPSALFALPGGAAITAAGLPTNLRAGYPVFSPNGKHVSFAFYDGPGADKKSLARIDFDKATNTFSGLTTLHTPVTGTAVWSSFLPNNAGVIFELETMNNGRDYGGTRSRCDSSAACSDVGARGELWWVDLATKTAVRLDKANGKGYLPIGAAGHDDDATLQYEPSVNPVVSGGYAWVVFVSRRMYGNVATVNPFWSDPRYHNLATTPTPKKLWVAAIDLSAAPGTDPSAPAFYLPGQELLAGNSRGYWVVDPCKSEGTTCETGDECCGGFCQPGPDGKGLVCTDKPPKCAAEFEKCEKDEDCCAVGLGVKCIGGRCAVSGPK